ncbi:hypothetical protein CEXT_81801 [Caerostris extrusa]|uniref:Secreted protein n=1 Tax=Caerostris extrusa TaxID=172846 RepID=A0AAV4WYS0_CAEEX|nr:hypothetical protein CEXT_81801 [Caerostris extrusa]
MIRALIRCLFLFFPHFPNSVKILSSHFQGIFATKSDKDRNINEYRKEGEFSVAFHPHRIEPRNEFRRIKRNQGSSTLQATHLSNHHKSGTEYW